MKSANPFPYSDSNKRYRTYDCFLKQKFGGKVIKIPLDGGFTCPNIDGTRGVNGCSYCNKEALPFRDLPLEAQFEQSRAPLMKKWWRDGLTERYIPYFQSFTGTYAPLPRLRALYYEALSLPNTVGLSIATRADCLGDEIIELLAEISKRTFLTVELGLQTVHEETAIKINRGHSYEEFLCGYNRLKSAGINICVHLINGLPRENREMMLETARQVALLQPHAVKLHALYLQRGSALAKEYLNSPFPMLSREEYVEIVVSQLELFSPETVIGRVTGDGKAEGLIAPTWSLKKFCVMNEIDKEFLRRDTMQGARWKEILCAR